MYNFENIFLYTACLSCDVCRNPHHLPPSPHSPFHCCTAKMAYLFDFCHFIYFMSCKHICTVCFLFFCLYPPILSLPFCHREMQRYVVYVYVQGAQLGFIKLLCVCVCVCVSACMHVCVRTVAFILYKHVHQVCEEKIYA